MSDMGDLSRINPNRPEGFLRFISENRDHFLFESSAYLSALIETGFLKKMYDKSPQAMDKAQLLVDTFGDCADPKNFSEQSKATNISPNTLSLIFSIAVSVASRSWDNFATCAYQVYGDMGDDTESEGSSDNDELFTPTRSSYTKTTPNPVLETPPKKQHKPKTKNTPNKKSGNTGQSSNGNQSKKKEMKSSTKHAKDDNKLKNPNTQKKAKNSSKSKGRNEGNNKVLAEILHLLRKLN
ncbi:hypothetical protein RhiirA4_483166 [Rhizophagus irregularis]|uniref:Uncharacterized protein n=1 Tax=Rhizophagus irregularis TaxID=588596 RepID=A0A2I1HMB0_9GLOM|nr:hypothetical protein RhiirA4_483166 [Rhizophagus irregularis]